jgi:hypothetical protein
MKKHWKINQKKHLKFHIKSVKSSDTTRIVFDSNRFNLNCVFGDFSNIQFNSNWKNQNSYLFELCNFSVNIHWKLREYSLRNSWIFVVNIQFRIFMNIYVIYVEFDVKSLKKFEDFVIFTLKFDR